MAYDPDWHRQYAALEMAECDARIAYRKARGAAKKAAAMDVLRVAGKARFDFEMNATKIVDTATLAPREWLASLLPG